MKNSTAVQVRTVTGAIVIDWGFVLKIEKVVEDREERKEVKSCAFCLLVVWVAGAGKIHSAGPRDMGNFRPCGRPTGTKLGHIRKKFCAARLVWANQRRRSVARKGKWGEFDRWWQLVV